MLLIDKSPLHMYLTRDPGTSPFDRKLEGVLEVYSSAVSAMPGVGFFAAFGDGFLGIMKADPRENGWHDASAFKRMLVTNFVQGGLTLGTALMGGFKVGLVVGAVTAIPGVAKGLYKVFTE
jgi:hypothetical protein